MTRTCNACNNQYEYDMKNPESDLWRCPACRNAETVECLNCGKPVPPNGTGCCSEECLKKLRDERVAFIDSLWAGVDNREVKTELNISMPTPEYRGAKFGTINALHPELKQKVTPFITGSVLNLMLVGPAGVGKTWAAWAVCYAWLVRQINPSANRSFMATDWWSVLLAAQEVGHFGSVGSDARATLNQMEQCGLLFVDEFAATKAASNLLPYVMRIINRRTENHRPTIITTTAARALFIENTGEGIWSRFQRGIIDLNGRDQRSK